MTIDKKSWGIRRNLQISDVMTPQELMDEVFFQLFLKMPRSGVISVFQIVISVSCGGNILINVGPTKEGTIIPIFEERLRQIGAWLKINGEGIYETRPWLHQVKHSINLYQKKKTGIHFISE